MSENRLGAETSPYLLQHKDNPVHWRAWGPEAFAEARARGVPVLLSVGYAACHWCHVMAHESFEDPAIAELMNAHFVSVKVDREERPDVDALYMTALHMLGEQGGWPLTMFLTPDGEPFFGGTYFPPRPHYGRPSFPQVLMEIHRLWTEEPARIGKARGALAEALARHAAAESPGALTPDRLDGAARALLTRMDPVHGGLGSAPKFPSVPVLELLWRAALRTGERGPADAVLRALDHMAQGGIYDHLGGGFSRYAVDRAWLVPHFEKMLYDNAALLRLLTLAHGATGRVLYRERIEETAGFVLREMTAPDGGFAASLDADSEGEEGRFYLWDKAEIEALLPPDLAAPFSAAYGVTEGGNFEGRTILNRLGAMDRLPEPRETDLARARARLLAARERRVRPGRDDKVLVDWNGLMIAALTHAGVALGRADWVGAARDAFAFILARMSEGDRLFHSYRDGRARHAALAEGYANMADAALLLHAATGEADYLARAERFVAVMDEAFADGTRGGYFQTPADGEPLLARLRPIHDDATPNANGTMISVLTRLHALTGKPAYRAGADRVVAAFAGEVDQTLFGLGTYLSAAEDAMRPVEVTLVGPDAALKPFRQAVFAAPRPGLACLAVSRPGELPAGHPASGKTAGEGTAAAFLCENAACSLPITRPDGLASALRGRIDAALGG